MFSKKYGHMMLDDVQPAQDINKIYHQQDTGAVSTIPFHTRCSSAPFSPTS